MYHLRIINLNNKEEPLFTYLNKTQTQNNGSKDVEQDVWVIAEGKISGPASLVVFTKLLLP